MKLLSLNFAAAILVLGCATAHAERADRTKPMYLEADHVSIDDAKQIKTFEGKVKFDQGTMSLRCDKMVVVQDKDGNMHGTATGQPASFRQKREGVDEYIEGYGLRAEYDSKTETLDLYGQARITRAQDEVRGEHITYNARTEVFQVHGTAPPGKGTGTGATTDEHGRVHVVIQPKTKDSAKDAPPNGHPDTPPQPEAKP